MENNNNNNNDNKDRFDNNDTNNYTNNNNTINKDIEDNKVIAALAYIIFFLPLIVAKDSEFGKFHANQGLILLLLGFAVSIVGTIIPFIGWFIIAPVGGLVVLVLGILGIVNALNGVEKELPIIGSIKLLK
jgi:uncharacterized membrane protein